MARGPARRRTGFWAAVAGLVVLAGCHPGGDTDYKVTVSPATQTVRAGDVAVFTVAARPSTWSGVLNVSISGVPATDHAVLEDVSLSFTQTLRVFTNSTDPAAVIPLTVTAVGSGIARTTTATLTIVPAADFALSVTPGLQQVKPGGTVDYHVVITASGAASDVTLSASGLSAGLTAAFAPPTLTGSGPATLTVSAAETAAEGNTSFDVAGTDARGAIRTRVSLAVFPADFSLGQSASATEVTAGGEITITLNVDGLVDRTSGPVVLEAQGLPRGATASFDPLTIESPTLYTSSRVTISTNSTRTGDYVMTAVGTNPSGSSSTEIPFTVVPGNRGASFWLSASPFSREVNAGDVAELNLTVGPADIAAADVTFEVSGLPPGASADIQPAPFSPPNVFELSVYTSAATGPTTANLTVTANGPGGAQSLPVHLKVDKARDDPTDTPMPTPSDTPFPMRGPARPRPTVGPRVAVRS